MAELLTDLRASGGSPRRLPGGGGLRATAEVLRAARAAGVPVAYTVCAYEADLSDAGPFGVKCPGLAACTRGTAGCEVDDLVAPAAGEPVLEKTQPSGFFGTDLAERLRAQGVDTVVVCGTTTSGCVRATVVDGMSHGFRAVVPIEAVADRSQAAHDQALFDMGHKYADVVPVADVVAQLDAFARARRRRRGPVGPEHGDKALPAAPGRRRSRAGRAAGDGERSRWPRLATGPLPPAGTRRRRTRCASARGTRPWRGCSSATSCPPGGVPGSSMPEQAPSIRRPRTRPCA